MAHRLLRAVVCALALLAVAAVTGAQLPDSPTGRRGNAIIAALRGGPSAATATFFEENFTPELLAEETAGERAERLAAKLERFGEIQLQGVQKTAAYGAKIMVSADGIDAQVEIRYALEEEEPHRITFFDISEAGKAIEPMSLEEMMTAATEHLEALTAEDKFAGVALVARGEEIVFEQAVGLANRRFEAANRPDTPFNLGSINKIFTKMALAQLASAGKLSFDDTIADHLPDYPNPEVAVKVTIAQLVNHTAGLGDIFTDAFAETAKERFRSPSDYFELFAQDDLLFEPGEGRQYSNGGYMVLGAIIEAASGQSYDDYVKTNIFEPAGMNATAPHSLDTAVTPIATGYTRLEDHEVGALRENSFMIPFAGTSAGGGYSTVRDLLAFRQALFGHQLLDARYTAWMITDELPDEAPDTGPDSYGIGLAGGGPGVNAALEMDGEWTIVVLTNLDPPAASDAAAHLRALIRAVQKHERP